MQVARSFLVLAGLFLVVPVILGGAVAGIVRATRRNLPPAELQHKVKVAFWITSIVTLAIELILLGLCLSALNQTG
ncbi:MAG: hypothetical protein QOG43_2545 [Actinomycetota bacterium]|jgi:uncharacterized Tic20 family protein|nr:hypothetical protein [Actinomycetota bacterium]